MQETNNSDFRRSRYLVDLAAVTEQTGQRLRLVICPACEAELSQPEGEQVSKHIAGHAPEDFGLSPVSSGAGAARRAV